MASVNSEHQALTRPKRVGRVEESVIEVASSLNDMVYGYCGSVCFMGDCDKQIAYEVNEESTAAYDGLRELFNRMEYSYADRIMPSHRVLFDEDSVVDEVSSRTSL
jgi:hypothetical protein